MFKFLEDGHVPNASCDRRVVVLPLGMESADELLAELYVRVPLEDYFGDNWNALSDCLRDLSSIREHEVWLVHQDLPRIPEQDLIQYLDVLWESTCAWKSRDVSKLNVCFPKSLGSEIRKRYAFPKY